MLTTPVREALWTVVETAHYLGVPVQTLYAWRKIGTGPPGGRVGKHLRYEPDTVRAWFHQQTTSR